MSKLKVFTSAEAANVKTDELPVVAGVRVLLMHFGADEIKKPFTQNLLEKHLSALAAEPVILKKTENGKPFVEGGGIHFNVSHSGAYWVLAIHRDAPVGIDLEVRRERARLQKVADRFFTAAERAHLAKISEDTDFVTEALTLWTRKEAYAKMTGSTILRELFESREIEGRDGATFTTLTESSDFVLSLAVAKPSSYADRGVV